MLQKQNIRYENVIIVGVITKNQNKNQLNEYLNELEFLVYTAGGKSCKRFIQKLTTTNSKTFIGKGKLNEIKNYIFNYKIDTIIFDDELTSSQLKNLIKETNKKIIDRTHLILDIFAQKAKSSYARIQVKLAQYEYLLPRLVGMWTHLERQKGGIGFRGPGETEIETDRRNIRHRISLLKEKLKTIDRQMKTQRKNRNNIPQVALVGYTNVGKSTIMNLLAKSNLLTQNMLFSTLDTTVRKININNLSFLLSDTVGFIRKLPTQLIKSFNSTLDEVRNANILLHIIDISHCNFKDHIESVIKTLKQIGCEKKPMILVFNKIDYLIDSDEKKYQILKKECTSNFSLKMIFISCYKKYNYEKFKLLLYDEIQYIYTNFLNKKS